MYNNYFSQNNEDNQEGFPSQRQRRDQQPRMTPPVFTPPTMEGQPGMTPPGFPSQMPGMAPPSRMIPPVTAPPRMTAPPMMTPPVTAPPRMTPPRMTPPRMTPPGTARPPRMEGQPRIAPPNFIPELPRSERQPMPSPLGYAPRYQEGRGRQRNFRSCLNRFTFIWLDNGNSFWFYPIFVRGEYLEGFRWRRNSWMYDRINIRRIFYFQCF